MLPNSFFHLSQSHFLFYKKISKSDIADEQKITAEDVRTGCLKLFVSPISCSLFDLRLDIKKTRNQNINLYIIFLSLCRLHHLFAHVLLVCVPSYSVHLMVRGFTLQGRVTKGSDKINYLIFIIHKADFMPRNILPD